MLVRIATAPWTATIAAVILLLVAAVLHFLLAALPPTNVQVDTI